ncbi:LysR family transcriptional regulator [Nitrincola sp. MINF-07-Sa-05]|uniref:LysR family transcriptional regulator n=1 Tax=Nitrincola salilacus TaxID=3400273 RepID=UPI0039185983
MNEQSIRWDDLQIVLAIAKTGSLSGAGRYLRMSHATVFRRLTDMEQRLGVSLFTRTRSGYTQSLAGEDLAGVAEKIQADVMAAELRLLGQDLKLSGTIRVTTTDTLFSGLLSPLFARFREEYPHIELEVVISNQLYSLARREADIAIRPTRHPPETLIGRRVAEITQAVYGQATRWQDHPRPFNVTELTDTQWIGPDIHLGDSALEAWMASDGRSDHCHFRVDTILGMQIAARQGVGVALLPCYLGDADEQLVRLTEPVPELATELWLLTHPDLRRVARIRAFMETIAEGIRCVMSDISPAD